MNIVKERQEENPWFEIGSSSILGTRAYQQDYGYYYTGSREVMALVCDGMGGMEGGERASKTAVEQVVHDYHNANRISYIPEFLDQEARKADKAVGSLMNKKGEPLGAGTTMLAVHCSGNQMYWISVGDSRIYLVRDSRIQILNVDHNYRLTLKMQLESGLIDQAKYDREEKTPQAEALISFVGMNPFRYIDGNQKPLLLQPGDIVALCSDGVYKSLNESQVHAMIRDNDLDMDIAADRLTAMALRYGVRGQDNTTAILMKYLGA